MYFNTFCFISFLTSSKKPKFKIIEVNVLEKLVYALNTIMIAKTSQWSKQTMVRQRYRLIPTRYIDDQRILESDWPKTPRVG